MKPQELKEILHEHELWVASKQQAGKRAYFPEADLRKKDLSGANLRGAFFGGANLSEANLSRAYLRQSDFRRANLSGANLSQAILIDASFGDANLANAKLCQANLLGAVLLDTNFCGADLLGAELSKAFLYRACFSGANLRTAKFGQARMLQTVFASLDLSEAIELDKVIHDGPSTIGMDTIGLSGGNIPDIFLRGCGLQDWEIELAKLYQTNLESAKVNQILYNIFSLRVDNPMQFYSCFISYSHADKSFAIKLHDELQKHGIRCWLDEKQILPGDVFDNEIDRGIRLWDKFLLCCSKNSLTSWWVDNEINKAFEKERRIMKERGKKLLVLIPLNLDGFVFSDVWNNGMKSEITRRNISDFINWDKENDVFEKQAALVIKALRADGGGREMPPPSLL